jgi:hypothetical protein
MSWWQGLCFKIIYHVYYEEIKREVNTILIYISVGVMNEEWELVLSLHGLTLVVIMIFLSWSLIVSWLQFLWPRHQFQSPLLLSHPQNQMSKFWMCTQFPSVVSFPQQCYRVTNAKKSSFVEAVVPKSVHVYSSWTKWSLGYHRVTQTWSTTTIVCLTSTKCWPDMFGVLWHLLSQVMYLCILSLYHMFSR